MEERARRTKVVGGRGLGRPQIGRLGHCGEPDSGEKRRTQRRHSKPHIPSAADPVISFDAADRAQREAASLRFLLPASHTESGFTT
jgi:hypothetical protein